MSMLLIQGVVFICALVYTLGSDTPWYKNAVIYQIYPRSFLDTDGDGIGDLKGVIQKADYLASLGITAVCLSPIYPSPNADFGYDISDYMGINPEFGTMKDFDNLVAKLKEKGIKVLLDFIPNHSSTQHEWFIKSESRNDTEEKYSDFYVWRDAKGYDENNQPIPPNNWLSAMYTGSSWKWSEKRKQFYLHNFLDQQADLNYQNAVLHKKMQEIMKFWMARGVAGFRVDTISWIYEDQEFKDEPKSNTYNPHDPCNYTNLNHTYTMDLPQNVDFVKELRAVVDDFTKYINDTDYRVLILESYSPLEKLLPYYGNGTQPGAIPFNFLLFDLRPDDNSKTWENSINNYYKAIGDHEPNWVIGNHDWKRVVSRWSKDWVDLLHIIIMTLRGTAISYYGEEIGLEDNTIRWDQVKDVQGLLAGRENYKSRARDFQRAPMPWNNKHLGGFTSAPSSWIPLAPSYWKLNVLAQESAKTSHLKVYRALTELRKQKVMVSGDCEVKGTEDQILYIIRSYKDNPTFIAAVNIGDEIINANVKAIRSQFPHQLKVLITSVNYPNSSISLVDSKDVYLPPKTGVVLST